MLLKRIVSSREVRFLHFGRVVNIDVRPRSSTGDQIWGSWRAWSQRPLIPWTPHHSRLLLYSPVISCGDLPKSLSLSGLSFSINTIGWSQGPIHSEKFSNKKHSSLWKDWGPGQVRPNPFYEWRSWGPERDRPCQGHTAKQGRPYLN